MILDPMCGTGTTGHVAKELKRNFIMIEREERYIEGIKDRLKEPPIFKERKKSNIEKELEEE